MGSKWKVAGQIGSAVAIGVSCLNISVLYYHGHRVNSSGYGSNPWWDYSPYYGEVVSGGSSSTAWFDNILTLDRDSKKTSNAARARAIELYIQSQASPGHTSVNSSNQTMVTYYPKQSQPTDRRFIHSPVVVTDPDELSRRYERLLERKLGTEAWAFVVANLKDQRLAIYGSTILEGILGEPFVGSDVDAVTTSRGYSQGLLYDRLPHSIEAIRSRFHLDLFPAKDVVHVDTSGKVTTPSTDSSSGKGDFENFMTFLVYQNGRFELTNSDYVGHTTIKQLVIKHDNLHTLTERRIRKYFDRGFSITIIKPESSSC